MGIRITWTDSNTAEDGYNVYRHTASMLAMTDLQLATYLLAELPADATEYEDGTAVDGTTYTYLVCTKAGSSLIRGQEVEVAASSL